jgi:uncharacterized repeat protein (TIGR03803 family)
MKPLTSLTMTLAAALLTVSTQTAFSQDKVLYSFGGTRTDGNSPWSGLVSDSKGNLYGTTLQGGANGVGTVFELSPKTGIAWTEKILHDFGETSVDGVAPLAGLTIDSKGNLYGTTEQGGSNNKGTIFKLAPEAGGTWDEKILYSFGATSTDGTDPTADLIFDSKGNLYGTTQGGGANGGGTAFELSLGAGGIWTEVLLWNFAPLNGDGGAPNAGMIFDTKGNLYGTTTEGGSVGDGTAFELMPSSGGAWTEKILRSFSPYVKDGLQPRADLVMDSKGNLYGTATTGGADGDGAAFELTPNSGGGWNYSVIHNFKSFVGDSTSPYGGLILDNSGNLYGTATSGGATTLGTVYELSPAANDSWVETILYNFGYNDDANNPLGRLLLDAQGNLFGTTASGGSGHYYGNGGGGTVFEIPTTTTLKPQFSPSAGPYVTSKAVKITDATVNATIYYTTNGENPTTSSTKYTEPIDVTESETLKAFATATGLSKSGVASATYEIGETTATPELSPAPGTFKAEQSIKITDTTPGAVIHYTTNSTKPTTTSAKYSGPISVTKTTTIQAIAIAPGYLQSDEASATYTIDIPTATPILSLKAGSYTAAQTVKITDSTAGAEIYYTTNGSKPTVSSAKYTGPITVGSSETIEAVALAPSHTLSPVATATYTIKKPAATPTFSPVAGTYASAQKVTIKDATPDVTIYYTTDGTTPTTSSAKYAAPITVSKTETIKALAQGPRNSASTVASAKFTIR